VERSDLRLKRYQNRSPPQRGVAGYTVGGKANSIATDTDAAKTRPSMGMV